MGRHRCHLLGTSISLFLGLGACLSTDTQAQEGLGLALGQWRTHYSYRQSYGLWGYGDKVYSIARHSLLLYEGSTESLSRLTRVQGLSDGDISALGGRDGLLVIGYANGGIDVWTAEGVRSLSALRDLQRPLPKRVQSIFFSSDHLYAGGAFGLLEFRLRDLALLNNYFELGEEGVRLAVRAGMVEGDSLFLATPAGIIAAHTADNLLSFENWERPSGLRGAKQGLCRWAGDLVSIDTLGGETRIFRRADQRWQIVDRLSRPYHFLHGAGETLWLGYPKGLDGYRAGAVEGVEPQATHALAEAGYLVDAWGQGSTLWVADSLGGLGQVMGDQLNYRFLSGPTLPSPHSLRAFGEAVYAFSRGPFYPEPSTRRARGFSALREGTWETREDQALEDVVDIGQHPQTGALYIGTSSGGIWRLQGERLEALPVPEEAGTLREATGQVSALGFDASGRLLVGTRHAAHSFLQYVEGEGWSGLSFVAEAGVIPTRIETPGVGKFWCLGRRGSTDELIYVDTGLQRYQVLRRGGDFTPLRIFNLAVGEDSDIWISASDGLYTFSRINEVLGGTMLRPERLRIDGLVRLQDIELQGVAVDGGGRIWVGGTEGLWRVDEARGEVFLFNHRNSPLPERSVRNLAYTSRGEVFVSTARGLLSYRSLSSSPSPSVERARIFPNPVHPDYTGWIGIADLPDDVLVQISALGGHLIRVVASVGGTASWDLRDRRGRRVSSGVYMVHIVSRDGEEQYVGKIAVIQ